MIIAGKIDSGHLIYISQDNEFSILNCSLL